jgi:hypothetical protein
MKEDSKLAGFMSRKLTETVHHTCSDGCFSMFVQDLRGTRKSFQANPLSRESEDE